MSASKLEPIVSDLRRRIVRGEFEPGSRLPTRRCLEGSYQISPMTLQRVFDTLAEDGFVEARGRAGTFVSPAAPHLTHFALLLHEAEADSLWYRALAHQTQQQAAQGRRVSCYTHIDGHLDVPDYQRLTADIEAGRIAGIIFSNSPHQVAHTPLLTAPGIPRCALMSEQRFAHIPAVFVDYDSFTTQAIAHLADRGRRRLAWLFNGDRVAPISGVMQRACAARHLTLNPIWQQYPYHRHPLAVAQVTHLLMTLPPDQRPDGLVITDDNLVPAATRGLAQAGIAPAELDVVALANFPELPETHFPVTFLGFDMAAMVAQCFAHLDRQRRGQTPPGTTLFPAQFAPPTLPAP
jgi:DNA-binding LacI/PurR family transcriptional regulator